MEGIVSRARIERRRERRYHADIASTLYWDGISQPVTIRNISAYGALLKGAHLPPVGMRVTLIAERMELWGTVIWSRGDQCALLLSGEIEPREILSDAPIRMTQWPMAPTITLHRVGIDRYA